MGRRGSGVEVREKSIRIRLSIGTVSVNETLRRNGVPIAPTPKNTQYAERISGQIRDAILAGRYRAEDYFEAPRGSSQETVTAALRRWVKTLADKSSATLRGYETAANFWHEQLGERRLDDVKRSDVLLALAGQHWSGKTRNNRLSILRQALDLAVADGLLAANPAGSIPAYAHQQPEPDPFTADERDGILSHFARHAPEPVLNYFEFMFFSGLRTSEGLGLHWQNVERGRVTVSQGLVDGAMTTRTKTKRIRTVTLNSRAAAALERQAVHTRMAAGRVFHDPRTGEPWVSDRAPRERFWRPALKVAQIRYRDPYHTRHTCATMMLMAGMNPAYVAAQLGHSVQVLLRVYAKWISSSADQVEMAKLENTLKKDAA